MPNVRWRRLGALALVALTAATLFSTGAGTAQARSELLNADFSYGCALPTEVCEEAGRQASDPAGVEAWMSRYEAIPVVTDGTAQTNAGTSKPGGFGFIGSPGPDGRRFFSWRFSRSTLGRQLPFSRCQRLASGQLVNCRFVGNIRFQASFLLRNRFVDVATQVNSAVPENLSVTSGYVCGGPSPACLADNAGPSLLGANSRADFEFQPFQLREMGSHDISFQWAVFDPVTRTTAWTPRYDSVNFTCTRFVSSSAPGDCFFTPGTRGDAS